MLSIFPYVKTHNYEREFVFFGGVQASRIRAAYVTFYTDVGSTKAKERTPTCMKQGFVPWGHGFAGIET